jgi:hypothetical protein
LTAFIVVSQKHAASYGKPRVIAVAIVSIALLLWRAVGRATNTISVCLLPAVFTLGYIVAFHLIGAIGFPGLLRDLRSSPGDYVVSMLRVAGVVFFL